MKQRFFVRKDKKWVEVTAEHFATVNANPVGPTIAEPTIAELATNFAGAMARLAGAAIKGERKLVTESEYKARETACAACEFWDGNARHGLGKCKAPSCGCTKFKRWLATERCKHPAGSRWPELTSAAN